jgi:hypothetical protein
MAGDAPVIVSLTPSIEMMERWDADRRRSHVHARPHRGEAAGTLRALARSQSLTAVCAVDSALVHVQAARRAAAAAGREHLLPRPGGLWHGAATAMPTSRHCGRGPRRGDGG